MAAVEATSENIIPVMVQRVDYARFRPDAISQNLLYVQGQQVYDVPSRSQSPYQTRTLFAAALSREQASSGTVRLVLPRALYAEYLANVPGQVLRTLEIDLADGVGYQPVTWDQPLTASYATAGSKRIKVRFTYGPRKLYQSSFATYESQFDLYVPVAANQSRNTAARTQGGALLANDSVTFNAQPGRAAGKAYIRYAAGHTTLVKPLIVLEGYDKHFIAPHISTTNYSIDQFILDIQTNGAFSFADALENVGKYDIVFVDYTNGTDDILLNAGLFEEVLKWVNAHKPLTAQNVVLGMSMGGLIGRYKLAEMEQANPGSTQVRLLVLQDSPQRGANLPLGISAVVQQLNNTSFTSGIGYKDLNIVVKEAVALLDQPATRQLLKYQALGPNDNDFFANTFIDGPYRQKVAYTAPYRIVAVSQGAQCGEALYAPYTAIVNASGSTFNGLIGVVSNLALFLPGYGGECIINALPDGSRPERVSGLYIYNKSFLFGIPIKHTITRQNFHCPAGLLPLDGGAGGTEPFMGGPSTLSGGSTFPNTGSGFLGNFFSYQYTAQTRFCFVPTASALDIDDFSVPALSGKYLNNIASVGTSRTSGFLAQQSFQQNGAPYFNQPHLLFTARNGEWMYNEMERPFFVPTPTRPTANPRACDATGCDPAANKTIGGPGTLCTASGGPATYTSPIQGPGYTYSWVASPASAFTVSSGSGPTFQTQEAVNSGTGTLTLTVNSGCEFSFSKRIVLGAPEPIDYTEDPVASDPCNKIVWYTINNYDPSLTYTGTGLAGISYGRFRVKGGSGMQSKAFTVTATNYCGTTSISDVADYTTCPYGYRYTAFPNPADDQLTVEQTDSASTQRPTAARGAAAPTSSTAPSTPYTVRLFDGYGVQRAQQATTTPSLSLPKGGLPTGLYLLHIEVGGTVVERRRVQITH